MTLSDAKEHLSTYLTEKLPGSDDDEQGDELRHSNRPSEINVKKWRRPNGIWVTDDGPGGKDFELPHDIYAAFIVLLGDSDSIPFEWEGGRWVLQS